MKRIFTLTLALVATLGAAQNIRPITQVNDINKVGHEYYTKPITWFAGDSFRFDVLARDVRTPLNFSGAFPVLVVAAETNLQQVYLVATGTVVSATNGHVSVSVVASNALLNPAINYSAWITVFSAASPTQEIATVAYSACIVKASPLGTTYAYITNGTPPWTISVGSVDVVPQDWSQYPATQTVNMAGQVLTNVGAVYADGRGISNLPPEIARVSELSATGAALAVDIAAVAAWNVATSNALTNAVAELQADIDAGGTGTYSKIESDARFATTGGLALLSLQYGATSSKVDTVFGWGYHRTNQYAVNGQNITGRWFAVGNTNYATITFIGGGDGNETFGDGDAIAGGAFNKTYGGPSYNGNGQASVVGGSFNTATGRLSFVGGGRLNKASEAAAIVGGANNIAGGLASFIGGGANNLSYGEYSVIPGGQNNNATSNSFASGIGAKATNSGSFVWSGPGTTNAQFGSRGDNTFNARSVGGTFFLSPDFWIQDTNGGTIARFSTTGSVVRGPFQIGTNSIHYDEAGNMIATDVFIHVQLATNPLSPPRLSQMLSAIESNVPDLSGYATGSPLYSIDLTPYATGTPVYSVAGLATGSPIYSVAGLATGTPIYSVAGLATGSPLYAVDLSPYATGTPVYSLAGLATGSPIYSVAGLATGSPLYAVDLSPYATGTPIYSIAGLATGSPIYSVDGLATGTPIYSTAGLATGSPLYAVDLSPYATGTPIYSTAGLATGSPLYAVDLSAYATGTPIYSTAGLATGAPLYAVDLSPYATGTPIYSVAGLATGTPLYSVDLAPYATGSPLYALEFDIADYATTDTVAAIDATLTALGTSALTIAEAATTYAPTTSLASVDAARLGGSLPEAYVPYLDWQADATNNVRIATVPTNVTAAGTVGSIVLVQKGGGSNELWIYGMTALTNGGPGWAVFEGVLR